MGLGVRAKIGRGRETGVLCVPLELNDREKR